MTNLIRDLVNYLEYLKSAHNLQITLHEVKGAGGHLFTHLHELQAYNHHMNGYCVYLKSNHDLWERCIHRQHKVHDRARQGEFSGACYCGVMEYIFPLVGMEKEYLGFLCVTGYRMNREGALERIRAIAARYTLEEGQIIENYDAALTPDWPDLGLLRTLVRPAVTMYMVLDHFMNLLYRQPDLPQGNDTEKLFTSILVYLNRNYAQKLTLQQVADHFHCSKSHISHMFSRKNPCNFSRHINIRRMEAAKSLLENTELSIQEIAFTVGISDANYFSNLFKRETALSPSAWRQSKRRVG